MSLENLFARWDFTNLNVAGFSFGFKGSFAQRLIENNREDVINAWWEDAFDQRPKTQLFVAQGDPYVIIVDVQTDAVSAYPASDGAHTAKNIAGDLATCLRALVSVQVYKPSAPTDSLTIADIRDALGADCDEQFWTEQIRHWSEFN